MYSVNNGEQPIVEPKPESDVPDLTRAALHQRVRQQEILAELGVTALQGASFNELLTDTVRLTAEGLCAEFCKVLEHIPSENRVHSSRGRRLERRYRRSCERRCRSSLTSRICVANWETGDFQPPRK